MLTKEIREWMQKLERGQYSYEDALNELIRFSFFLTREEIMQIKKHFENCYKM